MKLHLPARVLIVLALLALLALSRNYSSQTVPGYGQNPPAGPLHLWRAEGGTLDQATGQITHWDGSWPESFVPGKLGGGFYFPGVKDLYGESIPHLSTGNDLGAAENFTLATWVNFTTVEGAHALIASDYQTQAPVPKWIFCYFDFRLRFHVNNFGNPNHWLEAPFNPVPGRWYHLALTRQGDLWKFYVNGQVVDALIYPLDIPPDLGVAINVGYAERDIALKGRMDDVAIYARTLDLLEIRALQSAGFPPDAPTGALPQQLGGWYFDSGIWSRRGGENPVESGEAQPAQGFAGGAGVWISSATNATANLGYRAVEENGHTNFRRDQGTVRFWFRPDWGSTNAGGGGPGDSARLFSAGGSHYAPHDAWTLWVDASGENLTFTTRWGDETTNYFSLPIAWEAGVWHHLTLAYNSNYTALYVDGQLAAVGDGIRAEPDEPGNFYLGSNGSPGNWFEGEWNPEANWVEYWREGYYIWAHWENDYYTEGYWEGHWVEDYWVEGYYEEVWVEGYWEGGFDDYGEWHDEWNYVEGYSDYIWHEGYTVRVWVDDYYVDGYWVQYWAEEHFVEGELVAYWEGEWISEGYSDGRNESAHGTFGMLETFDGPLSVQDVFSDYWAQSCNDPPTIDAIANRTVDCDGALVSLTLGGISPGPPDEKWQTVTITPASSNTGLVPTPTVSYSPGAAAATLAFTPVINATGTALISLTVQDNGGTANDGYDTRTRIFRVTVRSNVPPVVSAGPNLVVVTPADTATLNGSVSDDGLPVGASVTKQWSKVGGPPGTVVFGSASQPVTTARFPARGDYVLRLTANDSKRSAHADVTVTVTTNAPPGVDILADDPVVTLPSAATLHAVVNDPTLPTGAAFTYAWAMESGPGTVDFNTPAAADTTATFSLPGNYIVRCTVNDSEFSASALGLVTVINPPDAAAPVVVVTNPVPGSVTTLARIQLQGHSPVPLASVYLERMTRAGEVERTDGFVMRQHFDTNTWGYTVNMFQCFDVALEPGVNQFVLHATGTNGAERALGLTYVLDLSQDTQAPVLTVDWPAEGQVIASDVTAIYGRVDDPTAQIIVRRAGDPASQAFHAVVTANGEFTVADFPVVAGSNPIVIEAVDAAGHTSSVTRNTSRGALTIVAGVDGSALPPASGTALVIIVASQPCNLVVNGVAMATATTSGTHIVNGKPVTGYAATVTVLVATPSQSGYQDVQVQATPTGGGSAESFALRHGQLPMLWVSEYRENYNASYRLTNVSALSGDHGHHTLVFKWHEDHGGTYVQTNSGLALWRGYYFEPLAPPGLEYEMIDDAIANWWTNSLSLSWTPNSLGSGMECSKSREGINDSTQTSPWDAVQYLDYGQTNSLHSVAIPFTLGLRTGKPTFGDLCGSFVRSTNLGSIASGGQYQAQWSRKSNTKFRLCGGPPDYPGQQTKPIRLCISTSAYYPSFDVTGRMPPTPPYYIGANISHLTSTTGGQRCVEGYGSVLLWGLSGSPLSPISLTLNGKSADANGVFTLQVPVNAVTDVTPETSASWAQFHLELLPPELDIKLHVDANHDGVMNLSANGPDSTSPNRPFRFWVNDDWDEPAVGDLPDRDLNTDWKDHQLDYIHCQRDLEDYARLWFRQLPALPSSQGYTLTLWWRGVGSPKIKIFTSVETDGGTSYLTDTAVAAQQVAYNSAPGQPLTGPGAALGEISRGNPYTFSADYFISAGDKYFLFEGSDVGKGELVLTIKRNGTPIAETGVFIELKDIKKMYERAEAINVTSGDPPSDLFSLFRLDNTSMLDAPPTESQEAIIFVHGINNTPFDYLNTSETMFKRLYWSGYQGRFAAFRWPCDFLPPDNTMNPFRYNISEFYAFKSATAFKNYLVAVQQRLPNYRINIAAHSQGNVVASEALRLGAPFGNYILNQAAAPAHAYEADARLFIDRMTQKEADSPTPFTAAEGGYHGLYSSLAGNLVNFMNPSDFALASGYMGALETNWEANQENYKPESFPLRSLYYGFNTTTRQCVADTINTLPDPPTVSRRILTDPDEMRSMAARSRSAALGAQNAVGGAIQSSRNLQAAFGFGSTRSEHSAQFNRTVQQVWGYYDEMILSFGIPLIVTR